MRGISFGDLSVATQPLIKTMAYYRMVSLASLLLLMGCGPTTDSGTEVELWVQGDLSRVEELQRVLFVIEDAHLQPAGFEIFPDHRVTAEWLLMEQSVEAFELVADNSIAQKVATLVVDDAAYDRVFLRPSALSAEGENSQSLTVKNVMEPIAAQFETHGRTVRVLLKLIVLPTSRGEEDVSIFAQDTVVLED